jgi:hypothetical protein
MNSPLRWVPPVLAGVLEIRAVFQEMSSSSSRSGERCRLGREFLRSEPSLRLLLVGRHRRLEPWRIKRALVNQLKERSYGGMSRALRRRLQSVAGASEKATIAVVGAGLSSRSPWY